MMPSRRGRIVIFWMISIVIMLAAICWAQRVKVRKDKIVVSPPDQAGQVLIKGFPGAIETTSPATLKIENLDTELEKPADIRGDGSFELRLEADPGQRIRVYARNEQKKRSYGTFKVPPRLLPTSGTPVKKVIAPTPRKARAGGLAVAVMIIDLDDGQVLACQSVQGMPRRSEHRSVEDQEIVEQIMTKCLETAQAQLSGRDKINADTDTDPAEPNQPR